MTDEACTASTWLEILNHVVNHDWSLVVFVASALCVSILPIWRNHRTTVFIDFLERTFPVRKFHWLSSSTIVNASATILHRIHFMAQCNASISCRNGFLFVEVKVQLLTSFPLYKFSPNRLADVCKLSLGFFFIDSKQRKSLGNYRIRWLQKESLVNCCSIVLKVCVFIYEFIVIIIVTISIVITGSYDARRYCTGLW